MASSNIIIIIDSKLQDSTYIAHPGDTLQLTLQENRSTGYSWNFKGNLDQPTARVLELEYIPRMVGRPSTVVYSWNPLECGLCEMSCTYARPWAQSDADLCIKFRVLIKEK